MKTKSLLIVLFILVVSVSLVAADGGYFPTPGYWVMPGQQRAVIFYENNIENLIVTSGFRGDAKELAWIIPTPTKPEITKASEEVFTNAAKLTMQKYDYGYGVTSVMQAAGGKSYESVVVIESKEVDYYDVNVLLATDSDELVRWFNEHGYSYPSDYSYVLDYYINKGWYFTALKVSPGAQGATEVIQDLREGNPTPVKLTFLSDKIVYPLKISSVEFNPNKILKPAVEEPIGAIRLIKGQYWTKIGINGWKGDTRYYSQDTAYTDEQIDDLPGGIKYAQRYIGNQNSIPIQVYLIADEKYEATNFYTQYGSWVNKGEIEKLGQDEKGNPIIQPKNRRYFLTSLHTTMQKSQMDEDLFFNKADSNSKVNAGPEAWQLFLYGLIVGMIVFVIWLFTPFGILSVAGLIVLFVARNKGPRIFGWIATLFGLISTFLIALTFFVIAASNNALSNYIVLAVVITSLIVMLLIGLFIALQAKNRR